MPSSHRATILTVAALGVALLVVAILATTGLIIWEPSTSADILLYNISSVLMISALACHIGCRIHYRCASVEAGQRRVERRQEQILTELRQTSAILQVLTAQTTGGADVDRISADLVRRLDELAANQWAEGFTSGLAKRGGQVAPFPRAPIGRG